MLLDVHQLDAACVCLLSGAEQRQSEPAETEYEALFAD